MMKVKKPIRVVVPNVVYLTNIPTSLNEELLMLPEFLGMYGELEKVVVHKNRSAHVVYKSPESADLCRHYVDKFEFDGTVINALEGTTKYAEDVDLKALRIASYKEPIRPVPKHPVFPMPRRYTYSRPAPVDACFVGTGTLVNKAWHPLVDNKLSPGSIDTFKSCFVPKFSFTSTADDCNVSNISSFQIDNNMHKNVRSTDNDNNLFPPAFCAAQVGESQQHHIGSNDFNSHSSNLSTLNSTGSSLNSYDSDEDDDKTPRGVADLGDDSSIESYKSGSKLNPSAQVYNAYKNTYNAPVNFNKQIPSTTGTAVLQEKHMNNKQCWRNVVAAKLN